MLIDKLKALYNLPMRDAVFIIRNKIFPVKTIPVERIATSAKLMRPARPWEFLVKYETVLARTQGWQPLDFTDKHYFEMGCGPLLGFAPLAAYQGAASLTCVEPQFTPQVLNHPRIVERYFKAMWNTLGLIYGPGPDFEQFMAALKKADVQAVAMAEAKPQNKLDIILSNSCLEHVSPLDASLKRLADFSNPGARFLHMVNFSNHMGTRDPFKGIYSSAPEKWFADNGTGINLLRSSDVAQALENSGFASQMTLFDENRLFMDTTIHHHWTDNYSYDELAVRAAVFSGTKT